MRDSDDDAYVSEIMKRAAPKADRPRLPTEYENILRPGDVARAECYARMERMTERLDEIARALDLDDSLDEAAPSDDSLGIVVDVADGGDSLVNHIDEAVMMLGR